MALVVLLAVFAVATMQAADYGIVINGYSVWEKIAATSLESRV